MQVLITLREVNVHLVRVNLMSTLTYLYACAVNSVIEENVALFDDTLFGNESDFTYLNRSCITFPNVLRNFFGVLISLY